MIHDVAAFESLLVLGARRSALFVHAAKRYGVLPHSHFSESEPFVSKEIPSKLNMPNDSRRANGYSVLRGFAV